MRKKIIIGLTILVIVGILSGCGGVSTSTTQSQDDVDSYSVSGDVTYLPLSYEHIEDGTASGIDIVQYVNINDSTIWVVYEKYQAGYGISFVQQFNENNNPVLYDGDIEELKQKYNVSE